MEKSNAEQAVDNLFVRCQISVTTYIYLKDLFDMERKLRDGYEKLVAIENRMAEHFN